MLSAAVTRAHRSLSRSVLSRSVLSRSVLSRPRPPGLRRFPSRLWPVLRLLQRQPQQERLDGSRPQAVARCLQMGPSAQRPLWSLLPPLPHHPTTVSPQFLGPVCLGPVFLGERGKNRLADKPGVCFDIVGWTTLGEDDRLGSGLAIGVDLLDAVVGRS